MPDDPGFHCLVAAHFNVRRLWEHRKNQLSAERLSTEDAPEGIDPSVGDIAYYAPWGNLAIFIRNFGFSSELILLGKIDGDIEALNVPDSFNVTIELIE